MIAAGVWSGLVLGAGAIPPPVPDEPKILAFDLPAAIQQALNFNRDLVRTALNLRNQELAIQGARADFGIRLRPDSNVGVSDESDSWRVGAVAVRQFMPGADVDLGANLTSFGTLLDDDDPDTHRASIRIEVRQPLFRNFGKLIQGEPILQAQHQYKTARRNYEQLKADLIVQVVEAYERILQLEGQIESDESFYARVDKLYRLTQARERQGRTTRVDSLRVELQRGQALSRLENSRERLSSTQREFAELLGFNPATSFELEPPPQFVFDPPAVEEAVVLALKNRLDYAQVIQDFADRERGSRIARRGLYPDLSLITRYERFGEGPDTSDATHLDENGWFFGLSSDTDFNGLRERTTYQQALISEESARQTIRIQELAIAREVQQQLTAWQRAQAEARIAARNLKLAENRAQLARRLFEAGRGDNFSVTDAEDAFIQARTQLLAANAEASVTTYRTLRSLGTLIEYPEDLKPPEVIPL
jgi:outer membrane protein TolC